jgi:hypothetical protein
MAEPEAHWAAAVRTERFVHVLLRSYRPDRYPTIAIASFFAASNYLKAVLVARDQRPRTAQELDSCIRADADLNVSAVLLPYFHLRFCFEDAFYLEEGEAWTDESARELERLRLAIEPHYDSRRST